GTSQPAALPRFEVVSIKPNRSGQRGAMGCHATDRGPQNLPLGRCAFTNITAISLFGAAFNQETYRTTQFPDWFTIEKFDIDAKAETPVTQDELALMFQAMFFDRFKLTFHREIREMDGLALMVKDRPKFELASNQAPMTPKEENTTILALDEATGREIRVSTAS